MKRKTIMVLYVALLTQLLLFSSCHAQPSPSMENAERPAELTGPGEKTARTTGHGSLLTGADRLLSTKDDSQFSIFNSQFKSIAVVANHTSVVGHSHLVDTLLARGVNVTKIFCPEHGFRGNAAAGATVKDGKDERTGLPIISLYGKNKKPTKEQLNGIDFVIFDLQDVGCRFYTYISTLHYVMEACAENGIPLMVLDRPNPNNYVDGPVLEPEQRSFVGMHPVPVVYGLTIGEYAQMINGEQWLKDGIECQLSVVPMKNYRRDSAYVLPVPPSPNLRNAHAIALYPSVCFFEGTAVSVGRGTPYPFEVFTTANDTIDLRHYETHRRLDLQPLLQANRHFNGKEPFFLKNNFFNLLAGTKTLRQQMEQGLSEPEIRASWQPALEKYMQIREKYIIYW